MRRWVALLLAMLLTLTAAGCGGEKTSPQPETPPEKEEVTKPEAPETPETAPTVTMPEVEVDETTPPQLPDVPIPPSVQRPEGTPATLPDVFPMELYFTSGAGGWQTALVLFEDGTFTAKYTDMDMGSTGAGYPDGTVYLCDFEGRFTDVRKLTEDTYALTLAEMTVLTEEAMVQIDDGLRYIGAVPYGMETGTDFRLYTPEKAAAELSQPARSGWPSAEMGADTLNCYALHNLTEDTVFYDWSYWFPENYDYVNNKVNESGGAETVYDFGTVEIALPTEQLEKLIVETGSDGGETAIPDRSRTLMVVKERASVEALQRDFGTADGGFLWSVLELGRNTAVEMVRNGWGGYRIFARSDDYYYAKCFATDVQIYRPETEGYADAAAEWEALSALGDTVCADVVQRNGLTALTQSQVWEELGGELF